MESNPLVSVIIPVYNVEPYLSEALDSVIRQTYGHLEIIVVDDGSADGSGSICDRFAEQDGRIRVIHQSNKGLSGARNTGLDRMTGEFCAFLDPDDAYEETYIEKLLTVMLRENADLVSCKYTAHTTDGRLRRGGSPSVPNRGSGAYDRVRGLRALADGEIGVGVWTKLYRKELWRDIRFPEGRVYEDICTTYRVFDLCGTIYVLDEPLYLHRRRRGSITDTFTLQNIRDLELSCSEFASFIESNTPDLFTPSQKRKWRQFSLNNMILIYIVRSQTAGEKDDRFLEELRKRIIAAGREKGVETLGLRTRIAWHMAYRCPRLLHIAFAAYRPVRQLVFLIVGR